MNFQRFMSSILIAVCVIEVVYSVEPHAIGKRIQKTVLHLFGKNEDDNVESKVEFTHKIKVESPEVEFSNQIQVAENETDLQTKLDNAKGKLIVMAIIDENNNTNFESVMNLFNKLENENIIMIVADITKCRITASSYGGNAVLPKYIFRKANDEKELSRYIRSDNPIRDYILINDKIKELLGRTLVQVALNDEEYQMKFNSAGFKLKIIWFQDDQSYDESGQDIDLSTVRDIADAHKDVLFIKINANTCQKTYDEYVVRVPSFSFYSEKKCLGFTDGTASENVKIIKQVISKPGEFIIDSRGENLIYVNS